MLVKRILLVFTIVFSCVVAPPSYGGDIISCDSFENCPDGSVPLTNQLIQLENKIDALEALLAGVSRGIDPNTSQDTLTFDNSISSEATAVRQLSTTGREGDFPVCFNGAGELLPCASDVEPPVVGDPYTGFWSGMMLYDREYTGDDVCYDADVTLRIEPDDGVGEIVSITVNRDAGGQEIYLPFTAHLSSDGYVADSFQVFGGITDYSLLFNTQGYAEGVWTEYFDDCSGLWSFTKD